MDHVFSVQAMVRGYHYYKAIWEAAIDGEVLSCEREVGNVHDTFAVGVKKDGIIVGHCPRKISSLCSEDFFTLFGKFLLENFGQENFGDSLPIHQIRQNFLPPIFSAIRYMADLDFSHIM